MKHIPYICMLIITFMIGIAFGLGPLAQNSYEYMEMKTLSEKHWQEACILSDMVRYSIDNGDTLVEEFYASVRENPGDYNLKFKGEDLDSLVWCY